MTVRKLLLSTLFVPAILSLAGCDSVPFMDNSSDYKAAGRGKPLEVPPDLTSVSTSDVYTVPGATYSEYSKEQVQQNQEADKILADPGKIKLERAGAQRWLVVPATPEKVWPVVREFWTDMGFAVVVENPQTGVMETQWTDATDLNKDNKGYLDRFQNWLDKMGALNNRIKFRTRFDQDKENQTTDIYLTHRKFSNVPDDGKVRVKTPYGEVENGFKYEDLDKSKLSKEDQAVAEDVDAEMLRRLMIKLGVSEQQSRAIVSAENQEKRAMLNKDQAGNVTLDLADQYDRAWRRVGLALDRIGFVVEDKNRSLGVFYLRYSDVENEDSKNKKGMLDKLKFWGDDETAGSQDEKDAEKSSGKAAAGKQYLIKLERAESGSYLYVADKSGQRDNSPTANRILNMLYDQLK
ncbi:MAG TPA: outer membrane protein assembly factor BamC [Methylophilaceae bacterium]|nr:outer membrane protein assembly factor BamC [Methylophilaceae bacterium]